MSSYADKSNEKSNPVAIAGTSPIQKNKQAVSQGDDTSAEPVAEGELQQTVLDSPQTKQLQSYQQMADNSAKTKQLKGYQAVADNYTAKTAQRVANVEEESVQGKFETVQRVEDEEPLQGKFAAKATVQRQGKSNNTGLPNQLKAGIESLSGISMDHVKVHYNSDRPAQLQAHAYAQGSDIHVAPGQEQHVPHEAWHVVQQAQGRVKPTMQMKGNTPVNDDKGLEHEADVMGAKAMAATTQLMADEEKPVQGKFKTSGNSSPGVAQMKLADDLNSKKINVAIAGEFHGAIPEGKERAAWGKSGIEVQYEADKIPLNDDSGKTVTPDPILLRLGFGYTTLRKAIDPYLDANSKPGKGAETPQVELAASALDYILPVLISDLGAAPKSKAAEIKPLIDTLVALSDLLSGEKLASAQSAEGTRVSLAKKLKRDLLLVGGYIGGEHAGSGFSDVAFESEALMVKRSQQMLERINGAAGALDNTIYKVGNDHVKDMVRERWEVGPKVEVYERTKYVAEYDAQAAPAKVVPKAPVRASAPPPLPVVSGGAQLPPPKSVAVSSGSGGVPPPVRLPVQVPAEPLVVSAPKEKPAKKKSTAPVVLVAPEPEEPVKSASDLKVERMLVIFNASAAKKTAKGYLAIQGVLGNYKLRLQAEGVIAGIKVILGQRDDRWAITKWASRSDATQKLYDDLAAITG